MTTQGGAGSCDEGAAETGPDGTSAKLNSATGPAVSADLFIPLSMILPPNCQRLYSSSCTLLVREALGDFKKRSFQRPAARSKARQ
ncbi:hypothetical protein GCM10010104_26430 [Streptomyces indiaensis]|uniref:Uncharacterized protein n=1 Tax=Streptomyces indiaensis TaxID=284033 RepID=A0ABN3DI39_9ACTN